MSEPVEVLINDVVHIVSMDVAAELLRLELEVLEHEQLFSLQWKADMRAIKMWQEANPGNDLVWPDSAKLSVWLLERLDAAREALRAHWIISSGCPSEQQESCDLGDVCACRATAEKEMSVRETE